MPDNDLIYLAPRFDCDALCLEDQRTCVGRALDLLSGYLEAARRDPAFKFILSGLDCLQPLWNAFPRQRAFLRELAATGRLEVNGGYNDPDETCVQGEALLRNLIHGRIFQRGILGIAPSVYLPLGATSYRSRGDSARSIGPALSPSKGPRAHFAHCPQLPQILRQLGFRACICWARLPTEVAEVAARSIEPALSPSKGPRAQFVPGVAPLCRAIALDGSEVIHKHEPHPADLHSWEDLLTKLGGQAQLDLRFIGGDLQPAPEWLLGRGEEAVGADSCPPLRVGLPGEYLSALDERVAAGAIELPASSRDLAVCAAGATVSRIELKIANRLAENALLSAERLCSIAWLLGAEYPHRPLDRAWRSLFFGQHHHAVTGALCDISLLDLMAIYREALELAAQLNREALAAIAGLADTAAARAEALSALVVFNALPWQRADICRARVRFDPPAQGFGLRDTSRRQVPCQLLSARREGDAVAEAEIAFVASEVPALGYAVYHVVAAGHPPQVGELREADRAVIENDHFTVTAAAQAGGGLISILDRQAKRQLLDLSRGHPGNEIVALGEDPDRPQPARTVFTTGEQAFSKDDHARVWVERGPVMERILVQGAAADCAARRQEIAVYRGLRRIDFTTELCGYRGQHQLFAAAFPLLMGGCVPVFEERFGAVARRRAETGYLEYRSDTSGAVPGCALLPAQNWLELGNCLRVTAPKAKGRAQAAFSVGCAAIITGGSAESGRLGERLLRLLASRGIGAGVFTDAAALTAPAPDTARLSIGAARFEGATFCFSLSVGDDSDHARRLLAAAPPDVREQAERALQRPGYAFVLTLEPQRENEPRLPVLLAMARDEASAAAALDELSRDAAEAVIKLPSQANAVLEKRALADDYGVAIINQGNIGGSVEADGTMVIALMRTAAWPDKPWGEGKLAPFFVPEHKTHRFRYALYAHRGDWRRAETARRAYEFNQPLMAVARPLAEGPLPARHSLLAVSPANVYLSALKPRGYPVAMGAQRDDADGRSIIVRIYEGHGETARAVLSTPLSVMQAWRADPLEQRGAPLRTPGAEVALDLAPYRIETVELAVQRQALLAGVRFGAQGEAVQRAHMRYWEHNLGPAPMGNQPLTVTMRGAPQAGATTRFSLTVASAALDRELAGMARVSVPAGWTITPLQVPYRLAPGEQQEYEVTVIIPADAQPAYIRAVVEVDGQVYEEVLPVGELKPVTASLRRAGSELAVTLHNPNADRVRGRVDVITPLETWGEAVGDFALAAIRPAAQGFDLEPNAQATLAFEVAGGAPPFDKLRAGSAGGAPDYWAYARIAGHGHVQYLRFPAE